MKIFYLNKNAFYLSIFSFHLYKYFYPKTKDGYILLSTLVGLNHYDGNNFKVYLPNPQKPFSLQKLQTEGIFEDSKKRLWICTHDCGLYLLDRKWNKFYHCQNADAKSKDVRWHSESYQKNSKSNY